MRNIAYFSETYINMDGTPNLTYSWKMLFSVPSYMTIASLRLSLKGAMIEYTIVVTNMIRVVIELARAMPCAPISGLNMSHQVKCRARAPKMKMVGNHMTFRQAIKRFCKSNIQNRKILGRLAST